MNRRWLGAVFVFLAGVAVGALITKPNQGTTPPAVPRSQPSPHNTPAKLPAVLGAQAPAVANSIVSRVIDGDTIELADGRRVRLIGIDAPESSRHECFAAEAKQANERLVLNRAVRLERDVSETDRFGRLLRYVYVGDQMINLQLVADGFAQVLTYPPDVRENDRLRAAMAEARQAQRGLWGGCPTTPSSSLPAEPPPTGCVIKGNINSRSEKIYHLPGCGSYEKTTIDTARGEQWFCTETDAVAVGFRKAGNCP